MAGLGWYIVTSAVSGVVVDTNWLVMVLAVDCAIGVNGGRETPLYISNCCGGVGEGEG